MIHGRLLTIACPCWLPITSLSSLPAWPCFAPCVLELCCQNIALQQPYELAALPTAWSLRLLGAVVPAVLFVQLAWDADVGTGTALSVRLGFNLDCASLQFAELLAAAQLRRQGRTEH